MKLDNITEEILLYNSNIKSVDFENDNYFSINDLNLVFMGAFRGLEGIPLPIIHSDGNRHLTMCINWTTILERKNELSAMSDFEKNINTALNFNPKKK